MCTDSLAKKPGKGGREQNLPSLMSIPVFWKYLFHLVKMILIAIFTIIFTCCNFVCNYFKSIFKKQQFFNVAYFNIKLLCCREALYFCRFKMPSQG